MGTYREHPGIKVPQGEFHSSLSEDDDRYVILTTSEYQLLARPISGAPPDGDPGQQSARNRKRESHFKGYTFILVLECNYWFIIEFYLLLQYSPCRTTVTLIIYNIYSFT